jgi:ankyrin repeat protein
MSQEFLNFVLQLTNVPLFIGVLMAEKLNQYELFRLTPEEATEMLWEELKKYEPDLQFIEDIFAYSPIDVNLQDKGGWTALMWTALFGNEKSLELLLNHPGIDVNEQDRNGWTALIYTACWGKTKCVELLLNHPGIDVNVQDNGGRTALMLAADMGNEKLVELLLNHPGIDVNVQDKWGRTAWDMASGYIRLKFPQLNPNS